MFRSDDVLEKVPVKGGRRSGLRVGVMMKISLEMDGDMCSMLGKNGWENCGKVRRRTVQGTEGKAFRCGKSSLTGYTSPNLCPFQGLASVWWV